MPESKDVPRNNGLMQKKQKKKREREKNSDAPFGQRKSSLLLMLLYTAPFYFISCLAAMWDLSSPTRDQSHAPPHWRSEVLTTGLQGSPRKSNLSEYSQLEHTEYIKSYEFNKMPHWTSLDITKAITLKTGPLKRRTLACLSCVQYISRQSGISSWWKKVIHWRIPARNVEALKE